MQLKSIRGRLPGGAVNMTLDGPVIITGPNDSGKTTLLNAVDVAMSGTTSDLGVDGHVDLEFDADPYTVSRYIDDKGKHQMQVGRVSGVRKAGAEAHRMLGSAGTFSAVAFLALSADKKQASLDQSGAVRTTLDVGAVRQRLDDAGWAEPALLHLEVGGGRGRPPAWPRVNEGQRYLSECRDWLREQHKANEARIKSLRGAQAEADKTTPEMPEGTAATWAAKRSTINATIAGIAARRGEIMGLGAGRKVVEERLQKVSATIAQINDKTGSHPKIIEIDKKTASDSRDRIAELHDSIELAIGEGRDAANAVKEYTRAERAVGVDLDHLNKVVEQADAMRGAASTLQVLVDAAANMVAEFPEHRALTGSEQALQDAIFKIQSLGSVDVSAELIEQRKTKVVERAGIRAKLDAAQRRQRASADNVQRMERAKAQHTTSRDRADASVVTKGGALEMYNKQLLDLAKERETLTDQLAELPVVDHTTVDIEEQGARAELADVENVLQRFADSAGHLAAIEERRADITDAIEARQQIVSAGKTVKKVLLDSMAEALEPLTSIASGITKDVMGAEMRLLSDGGINLSLDFDGELVDLKDASNSQRMTALMALQVAVQSKVPGWRSVFLDDLEGLEADRRTKFVEAMAKAMRDGLIDNFVGASVEDGWTPPEGVQHVQLGA